MKKLYKPEEEFVVGKHNISYVYDSFKEHFYKADNFEKKEVPIGRKLPIDMTDAEIESELKPGLCELGDILAFLENPPEGSKDGYWNLFYTSSCVVDVYWYADDREWRVGAWRRGGRRWFAGGQVFYPATGSQTLGNLTLGHSDSLNLPAKGTMELEELETVVTKISYKGRVYVLEK